MRVKNSMGGKKKKKLHGDPAIGVLPHFWKKFYFQEFHQVLRVNFGKKPYASAERRKKNHFESSQSILVY